MNTSFDYIVCGGGTAGCTIAARLSEIPHVTVGLIEAGKSRLGDPLVDIPAMFGEQFQNPEYDWCIFSEPQVRLRIMSKFYWTSLLTSREERKS